MKLFAFLSVFAINALKPALGQIVEFKVDTATLWAIEDEETNNVVISFDIPSSSGFSPTDTDTYLSAAVTSCGSASDYSVTATTGSVSSGLTVTLKNEAPVVSTSYCISVALSFNFDGGPEVIHVRSFTFTVTADETGQVTPSPVEKVDGFIATSGTDTGAGGSSVVTRVNNGITLVSNPTSSITFNEDITLTVIAPSCCGAYWYRITAVTIGGNLITPVTLSGWSLGSNTATATFKIPISVYAAAGQGGDIAITGTVEWSVVDPDVRVRRGLQQEGGDTVVELTDSGLADYDVVVTLDPSSIEEAQNGMVTAGGSSVALSMSTSTMIAAAAGAMAAVTAW
ncbi:hypothetical protein IV203_033577 [Nitzschia inconspicua]|uniref:Uncharacterized protein n=1 Tax=Nitzschia inconspicua TaxID=303405 RepID=A0A9K3Q6J9_9STRA|nr:hypothetical protein IV203_033577 [Nitzschia inconspicua]